MKHLILVAALFLGGCVGGANPCGHIWYDKAQAEAAYKSDACQAALKAGRYGPAQSGKDGSDGIIAAMPLMF